MKIPVSELIVRFLERLGVQTIFGMPGAHILPVYDSLYDSPIDSVLVKHEQGAAFMAGGYARVSHRPAGKPREFRQMHRTVRIHERRQPCQRVLT